MFTLIECLKELKTIQPQIRLEDFQLKLIKRTFDLPLNS